MTRECKGLREELAEVAEGRGSQTATAHVAACPSCQKRVGQYRAIFEAARLKRESAPESLIAQVWAMMPDARKTILARRLSPLIAGAVRRQAADFQIIVGDEESSLRLMVRPESGGWLVMGRLPEGDWSIGGVEAEIDEDRFSFRAPALEETAFTLEGAERRMEIPPLSQLVEGDDSES